MRSVEVVIGTVLSLIALFLVLNNADKVSTIMKALGDFANPTIKTLQAR